jgi:NitT/TauT family transport system substrate-binding protein
MNPEYADKKEVLVKQIEADIKGTFFSADTKAHGLGWMTKDAWSKTTQILLSQGAMPKAIDVDAAFNDKFLSGANALKQ